MPDGNARRLLAASSALQSQQVVGSTERLKGGALCSRHPTRGPVPFFTIRRVSIGPWVATVLHPRPRRQMSAFREGTSDVFPN